MERPADRKANEGPSLARTMADAFRSLAEAGRDPAATLAAAREIIEGALGGTCSLWRLSEDGTRLHLATQGLDPIDLDGHAPDRIEVPVASSLQGRALAEGKTVRAHRVLLAPLRARGRNHGLIHLVRADTLSGYTQDDEELFSELATLTGLVFDNALAGRTPPREPAPAGCDPRDLEPLAAALMNAPFGFALVDGRARLVQANAAFADLIESPLETHAGRELGEILPEPLAGTLARQVDRVLATGTAVRNQDVSITRPIGKTEDHLASFFPVLAPGQDQVLVGMVFIEAKVPDAGVEISWNQERLRNITDVIPMLVTYMDRDFRYRFNNRTYDEWFGTPHRRIYGRKVAEILGEPGFSICKPWMDRALNGEKVVFERPMKHPTKGVRQVQIYYAPDRDSEGHVNGMVAAVMDVTEERELRQKLEFQNRRLSGLVSQIPAVVWEIWEEPDASKERINFVSDHIETMLGYTPEEARAGTSFWKSVVHPEDLGPAMSRREELLRSGRGGSHEYRMLAKDGRVAHVETSWQPILDDAGRAIGLRGLTTDITVRKKIENELKRAKEELEKSVRIRDDFLSIAAHELKTPITTVKLQNQMLLRFAQSGGGLAKVPEDRLKNLLATSDRQVGKLVSLVDDLLDVSRISSGQLRLAPSETDLVQVAREAIDQFTGLNSHETPAIELEGPAPVVGAWDRVRLEQVVVNLVSNAVKYGAGRPVTVRVFRAGDDGVLEVRDEGIGIPLESQARIFERFERAMSHRHISGWGLGLYIVRKIVESHQGKVALRSAPGRGSTFTVTLPLAPARRNTSERS